MTVSSDNAQEPPTLFHLALKEELVAAIQAATSQGTKLPEDPNDLLSLAPETELSPALEVKLSEIKPTRTQWLIRQKLAWTLEYQEGDDELIRLKELQPWKESFPEWLLQAQVVTASCVVNLLEMLERGIPSKSVLSSVYPSKPQSFLHRCKDAFFVFSGREGEKLDIVILKEGRKQVKEKAVTFNRQHGLISAPLYVLGMLVALAVNGLSIGYLQFASMIYLLLGQQFTSGSKGQLSGLLRLGLTLLALPILAVHVIVALVCLSERVFNGLLLPAVNAGLSFAAMIAVSPITLAVHLAYKVRSLASVEEKLKVLGDVPASSQESGTTVKVASALNLQGKLNGGVTNQAGDAQSASLIVGVGVSKSVSGRRDPDVSKQSSMEQQGDAVDSGRRLFVA
jgi:hypothetical protein